MSASGRPGRRWPPAREPPSRAIIGMANARVLPLPVFPRPSTSRPESVSGSVSTWIGKGESMPCADSAATRAAGTPSALKEEIDSDKRKLSDRTTRRAIEPVESGCEVARAAVATIDRRRKYLQPFRGTVPRWEKRERSTTQGDSHEKPRVVSRCENLASAPSLADLACVAGDVRLDRKRVAPRVPRMSNMSPSTRHAVSRGPREIGEPCHPHAALTIRQRGASK